EALAPVDHAGASVQVAGRDDEPLRSVANVLVLRRGEQEHGRAALVLALAEVGRRPVRRAELEDLPVDLLVRLTEARLVCGRTLGAPSHDFASSTFPGAGNSERMRRCRRARSGSLGTRRSSGSSTSVSRIWRTPSTSTASASSASAATSTAWSGSS